jgi:hypothetical protein
MLGQNDPPTSARKRAIDEYSDKENQSPGPSSPPPKKQKRTYKKRRTIDEKLGDIFTVIDKAGWSFADFLYIERKPVFPVPIASMARRSTRSKALQIPSI